LKLNRPERGGKKEKISAQKPLLVLLGSCLRDKDERNWTERDPTAWNERGPKKS